MERKSILCETRIDLIFDFRKNPLGIDMDRGHRVLRNLRKGRHVSL